MFRHENLLEFQFIYLFFLSKSMKISWRGGKLPENLIIPEKVPAWFSPEELLLLLRFLDPPRWLQQPSFRNFLCVAFYRIRPRTFFVIEDVALKNLNNVKCILSSRKIYPKLYQLFSFLSCRICICWMSRIWSILFILVEWYAIFDICFLDSW